MLSRARLFVCQDVQEKCQRAHIERDEDEVPFRHRRLGIMSTTRKYSTGWTALALFRYRCPPFMLLLKWLIALCLYCPTPRAFCLMFTLMLLSCDRCDRASTMTDALAVDRRTNGLQLERGLWLHRLHLGHDKDEDAVAVGRIGQGAIHRLREENLTIVGTDRPLRQHEITLMLA